MRPSPSHENPSPEKIRTQVRLLSIAAGPSRGGGRGKLPRAPRRLGPRRRSRKKNSKIFSPEGPRRNVSLGPVVVLDVLALSDLSIEY